MSVRLKVTLSLVVYGTIAILAVTWSYAWMMRNQGPTEDFIKLAALWLTILPGAFTAWMSYLVLTSQQSSAVELERLKIKLAAGLELTKLRLDRVGHACEEMNSAANLYYYAVASLERGVSVTAACKKADGSMIQASCFAGTLDDEVQNKWTDFWQCARRIAEMSTELNSPTERRTLWQKEAKELGRALNDLVSALQCRMEAMPNSREQRTP